VCKKLIKNSQPFGKRFQKTVQGDFFDSHCSSDALTAAILDVMLRLNIATAKTKRI